MNTPEQLASDAVVKIQSFVGTTDEKAEYTRAVILAAILEGQLTTLTSVREAL